MRGSITGGALMAALAAAAPGAAQESCPLTQTPRECLDRVRSAAVAPLYTEKEAGEVAIARVAQKAAGENDAGQPGSTIDDFIPRLAAAALVPGLDTGTVGRLDLNYSLANEHFNYLPVAIRFGAEVRRPTVYAAMLDSIPEARRPGVRERFEGDFGEFDDVELTFALNRESLRFGRRYEPHTYELAHIKPENPAIERHRNAITDLAPLVVAENLIDEERCKPERFPDDDPWNAPLSCFKAGAQDEIQSLLAAAGAAAAAFETGFDDWARMSGWVYLPDLINNQPQLSASITWRPREHAVGPESWTVSGRWERGLVNLNSVRSFCARPSEDGYEDSQFTDGCYQRYMESELNRALLRRGLRGFVETRLTRERHYDAPFLDTDSATFSVPAAWRASLEGGFGGYLPTTAGETQGTRLDLGVAGEWALTEDQVRPDKRLSVSLNLTQRLNDNFSVLSGLVWSDRGEFKGDDITPVRLRLGVRYKLVPTAPQ